MINLSTHHTFRPSSIEIYGVWCDELTTELKDNKNITVLTIKTTTPSIEEFKKNKKESSFLKLEVCIGLNNKYIKKNKLLFKKANFKENHEDEKIQIPLGVKFCIKTLKEIIHYWNNTRNAIISELFYERVTGATINIGSRVIKVPFKWNEKKVALGVGFSSLFDGNIPKSFSINELEYKINELKK